MTRKAETARLDPVSAWVDELRRDRRRRVIFGRPAMALGAGIASLLATLIARPGPRLIWNASRSAPLGLYRITPDASLHVGDMVAARIPTAVARLAADRHYLPLDVPLIKRVAALSGDDVCATGDRIRINGRAVATRLDVDAHGRSLPGWTGCRHLRGDEVFLLMADVRNSFDGRYFGLSRGVDVIGRARLLWRR